MFPITTILASFLFLPCLLGSPINPSGTSPLSTNDAVTVVAIQQLLSLFSISLDLKTFSTLSSVFAPDAEISDDGAEPLIGLPAITDFYTKTFQNASLKTEHTSDTVYAYDLKRNTAKSISYAAVAYFGPAVLERGGVLFSNSSVTFRERFENEYVKLKDGWRVKKQKLTILSIEGPESILKPA
ncbi:MAG: hypothetical protein L6R40_007739 [Gallowayella cf. fulva]|nr:MAG: hypothetical protein L6R40_007739 [Xanthomendoza cf. fulva]